MTKPTLDLLREQTRGSVISRTNEGYEQARRVYNAMIDKHPHVIVRAPNPGDVKAAVDCRVTEFDPDRRVAIHDDIGPFKGTLTYVLEAVDHGTRLLNTAELDANGVLKAAAPIAAGRIRRAVAQNLQELKHILESEAR